jgi:uncharacterized protein YbbK (DUF523 family)
MTPSTTQGITSSNGDRTEAVGKVLVSGCINGRPIRFNRTSVDVKSAIWDRWAAEERLVPFCAELAAGFAVPRPPAEIVGGEGSTVFTGNAVVLEDNGSDDTEMFVRGAELAVAHAVAQGCVVAVLTDGSPSCGSTYIYDGSFGGGTKKAIGVTAQILIDHGVPVFSENQLELADEALRRDPRFTAHNEPASLYRSRHTTGTRSW